MTSDVYMVECWSEHHIILCNMEIGQFGMLGDIPLHLLYHFNQVFTDLGIFNLLDGQKNFF